MGRGLELDDVPACVEPEAPKVCLERSSESKIDCFFCSNVRVVR